MPVPERMATDGSLYSTRVTEVPGGHEVHRWSSSTYTTRTSGGEPAGSRGVEPPPGVFRMRDQAMNSKAVVPVTSGTGGELLTYGGDFGGESCEIVDGERGKMFLLKLDARHFNPEDLSVKVENGCLVITGKHEEKGLGGSVKSSSFNRRCTIPPGVRVEDLNCSLDCNGRMIVSGPVKTESTEGVKYKVGSGGKEVVTTLFCGGSGTGTSVPIMTSGHSGMSSGRNPLQEGRTCTTTETVTTRTYRTVS